MPTYNRPSAYPTWTDGNAQRVQQPPNSLVAAGWVAGEAPSAAHMNYLFWQLGNWVGYLDQANAATVMSATLDAGTRLVGGGTFAYVGSSATLSWSDTAYLSIPSIPQADNALAAGSVVLGAGKVAYTQANVPFTTVGQINSGDTNIQGVLYPSAITVGATVTGSGVPSGTAVTGINGGTVSMSAAATATNATATLTFASAGALTVQVADVGALLPNPNTVILALGTAEQAIVGVNSGQMTVRSGEAKTLLGAGGFATTVRAPAGAALSVGQAVYLSNGTADGRTVGSIYPAEAGAANGANRGQVLGFTNASFASGATAHVVSSGLLTAFTGLTPGIVYYLSPTTPGALTSASSTTPGQFVVPVGFAVSATTLRINPTVTQPLVPFTNDLAVAGNFSVAGNVQGPLKILGAVTAPSATIAGPVVSSGGFKSVVYAGSIFVKSATANASYPATAVSGSTSDSSVFIQALQIPMPFSGSIVGLTAYNSSSGSGTALLQPRINGVVKENDGWNYSQQSRYVVTYGRDSYKFNAGDYLDFAVIFAASGQQHSVHVYMTVQLDTGS